MAGPMAGVQISAQQIAQQKLDNPAQQQLKTHQSKFDAAMANKANGVQQAQQVQHTNKVDVAKAVEQIRQMDKAQVGKIRPGSTADLRTTQQVDAKPESSKSGAITNMLDSLESGQTKVDQLISLGVSGAHFNNAQLLALQAGVYKYTQEMELTGKVVEQATSGLKDTLKTQV